MTKSSLSIFALLLASGTCLAAPVNGQARVIRVTPAFVSVNQPMQVCEQGYAAAQGQGQPSGAGGLIGGILGGIAGHQVGKGSGNTAATIAGALGGAYLGNRIEANEQASAGGPQYVPTQTCHMQDHWVQQQQGFNVTYEYGHQEFTQRLPYEPGEYVHVHGTISAE